MSKMRILSKKTFALGPGASRDGKTVDQIIAVRGAIQEIDEKYKNDPTFQLAVKAGEIIIMNDNVSIGANNAPIEASFNVKEELAKTPEEPKADPVEKFKEELKLMKREEVKAAAEKYNSVFSEDDTLKANKKRLLEAYKLSIEA